MTRVANAFRDYESQGVADAGAGGKAELLDLAIGVLLGVIAWPFPVVRMLLEDATGSAVAGWAVHVPLLLLFMATAAWLASGATIAALGRTVGMYFLDLGFQERPSGVAGALRASCTWTLAGLARLVGAKRPTAGLAEARLASTRSADR